MIREKVGDVPVIRAMHFFEDNKRVDREAEALKANDFKTFMENVIESGRSSYMYNQNVFNPENKPDLYDFNIEN